MYSTNMSIDRKNGYVNSKDFILINEKSNKIEVVSDNDIMCWRFMCAQGANFSS